MELEDAIGGTPVVRLRRLAEGAAEVWVKLEGGLPGGSVKDRAAWGMVRAAEERGELWPGRNQWIVEATSGNTGIALAMIAAARGYRYLNVATEGLSPERRAILRAYGAELAFVPSSAGMAGARERAAELAEARGGWWADQFSNPDNPAAHERGTGPEAWAQLGGKVDALVLGTGTGGSLTGMGRYLREQNPQLRIVALEPATCRVLEPGPRAGHPFQGIGPGFVPAILDRALVDEVMAVPEGPAFELGRRLWREEGLLLGLSAMANVWGALEVARRLGPGKRVLTLAPDSGFKYLSTPPYDG
ncbi:PLP-dependent cysteine synthase family protein [Oceanithermus sp.]